ncbi:hypothetical protein MCEMZLE22_00293 [actinobacterium SCGC AAA044-D11]
MRGLLLVGNLGLWGAQINQDEVIDLVLTLRTWAIEYRKRNL